MDQPNVTNVVRRRHIKANLPDSKGPLQRYRYAFGRSSAKGCAHEGIWSYGVDKPTLPRTAPVRRLYLMKCAGPCRPRDLIIMAESLSVNAHSSMNGPCRKSLV